MILENIERLARDVAGYFPETMDNKDVTGCIFDWIYSSHPALRGKPVDFVDAYYSDVRDLYISDLTGGFA